MKRVLLHWVLVLFIGLTLAVFTQVGLVTFIISTVISRFASIKNLITVTFINVAFYLLVCFLLVPQLAPMLGRVPITTNENLKFANSILMIGLNRNYVVPELNEVLTNISKKISEIDPNAVVLVLDANFPFIDGYPLVPHLSHNDGRKLDLAYMYLDPGGNLINKTVSNSGYGYFEGPLAGEYDTTKFCKDEGYFQYDYPKFLTLGKDDSGSKFSNNWNRVLLETILAEDKIQKLFVERHIVARLGLKDKRLRFQGCGSVRHDDHIHFQI